jgi:hypothetical protein
MQNKRKIMQCTSKTTNSNYSKKKKLSNMQQNARSFGTSSGQQRMKSYINLMQKIRNTPKLWAFQSHIQSHHNIHSHHAVDKIRGQLRRQIQQSTKTLRGSGSGSLNLLRLGIHRPQRRCRRDRILRRMIPCQFLHVARRIVNHQSA